MKFVDLNNDGAIDAKDRTYLGSATPDFSYALNGSLEFKGGDVRVFFQGVEGNAIAGKAALTTECRGRKGVHLN